MATIGGIMLSLILSLLYFSVCIWRIGQKVDAPNLWMGWVPVLNLVLVCQMGKESPWWVLLCLVPYIGGIEVMLLLLGKEGTGMNGADLRDEN